ncbi:MAG: ester cyclase [Salinisphaera sp.]|nr:ester cyclase [Salinisphaera sp.]
MESNSNIVRRFIEEVLNQGDIDAAGEFFWDDMVELAPFPGQGPGLEGLKEVLRGLRAAFPDMHWTVREQIADGDRVLSRFDWTGTHRGTFLGVPATDRTVMVWGMVIDRFEGEKIKDTRIIMDTMGRMMQLGVVPPPEA